VIGSRVLHRTILNNAQKEMFEKVAPQRIRDEIELILKEENPIKSLKRMAQLDELRFLHPKMKLDAHLAGLYSHIAKTCSWYDKSDFRKRSIEEWVMYFMALTGPLSYKEAIALAINFHSGGEKN